MTEVNGKNGVKPLLEKNNEKPAEEEQEEAPPLLNSYYCMFSLGISVSSVMMSTGIAVGALNPAIVLLNPFYNETYQARFNVTVPDDQAQLLIALSVSMLLAGGFVGSLCIGFFLNVASRKQSMIIMNLTNVVAVIIMCAGGRLGYSHEAIAIGRFIMGVFSGFGMNLIPIVVAELCTVVRQPFYLSLIGVNLSVGSLIGLLLGYKEVLGTSELWPVLLAMSSLPSIAYLLASPWLPESPSYLLRQKKKHRALKMLRKIREESSVVTTIDSESMVARRDFEEALRAELEKIETYQKLECNIKRVTLKQMFQSQEYRRQLIVVVLLFIQVQLSGINAVGMYTNMLFQRAGFLGQAIFIASTIVYAVQCVVAIFGSLAIDRFGPKRLNIMSGSIMALSLVVLTIAMVFQKDSKAWPFVSVVAVTVYVVVYACGLNLTLFPMLGLFTSEVTREMAFFFGGGIFWVFSWFVSFILTYLLQWIENFAFLPFVFFNIFFVIYVFIFVPETNGKTPKEVQDYIHSGKNIFNIEKNPA